MKIKALRVSAVLVMVLLSGCAYYHAAGAQVASELEQNHIATTHAILYEVNSAQIDPESKPVLDSVVQYLESNPTVHIEIWNDSNNISDAGLILPLSRERAEAAKAYIVASGVDPNRVIAMN